MTPLVSILIPAYNSERWIAQSIESALAQTWPRKEIIIVDDGSRDNTLGVSRRYQSSSVQVLTQPNGGASAARNTALRSAQGDYIQWLDADDLLHPEKIAAQLEAIHFAPTSLYLLSSAWGEFYSKPERAKFAPNPLWEDLSPAEWLRRKMQFNLWMSIESWLVSRELTQKAGPWDPALRRDNDGEYFCRVLRASAGTVFVACAKSYVRRGVAGSVSSDAELSDAKLTSLYESLSRHVAILRSLEDSENSRMACLAFLQNWLHLFYPEKPLLVEKLKKLASELGGDLREPSLPWKYDIVRKLLGWRAAKQIRGQLLRTKHHLAGRYSWCRVLMDL